jgi:nitrous oxide reductase
LVEVRGLDGRLRLAVLAPELLCVEERGRGEATLIFRADTPGVYTFECSKMCGAGHSFMRGEIIVQDQESQQ